MNVALGVMLRCPEMYLYKERRLTMLRLGGALHGVCE